MGPLSKTPTYDKMSTDRRFVRRYQEGDVVPFTPHTQTGLPEGGYAQQPVADYLAGVNTQTPLSYVPDAHSAWLGQVAQQGQVYSDQLAAAGSTPGGGGLTDFGPGEIATIGGGHISYDTPGELTAAGNIASIIEEGGINPETGDPNIVAGPNVLSAGDEGVFGFGDDYNEEFIENYDAAAAHAAANPTGMTTGNPIYDHGYVAPGGIVDTFVNNSLIGTVGSAITSENLVPTYDDLLPPAAAFDNDSGGSDDNNEPNTPNTCLLYTSPSPRD